MIRIKYSSGYKWYFECSNMGYAIEPVSYQICNLSENDIPKASDNLRVYHLKKQSWYEPRMSECYTGNRKHTTGISFKCHRIRIMSLGKIIARCKYYTANTVDRYSVPRETKISSGLHVGFYNF